MRRLFATFALGLLAASCGGSSGGGGGDAGLTSIPQAQACTEAAQTACTKIFSCSDQGLLLIQVFLMTVDMCEATAMQNCGATGFQCAATQTYHGDKAAQCRDAFNAQSCATLAADVAGAGFSTTAILGSLTAQLPVCGQICTGGTDAATGG
jgi:hypothetical protein